MTSIVTKTETVKKVRYQSPDTEGVVMRKNIRKKVVKRWYSKNNITNADLLDKADERKAILPNGEIDWNKLSEVNAE